MARRALSDPSVPLVTSLPASPVDGQQIDYLADSAGTNGGPAIWRLRYRAASASASKWEYISGSPLMKIYNQNDQLAGFSANTWGSVTNDPSIIAPLAGDYITRLWATISPSLTCTVFMGVRVGATDPDSALAANCVFSYWPSGMQTGGQVLSFTNRYTVAAATAFLMRERHNAASAMTLVCGPKGIELEPVRVG